jgi:hypothetical protein
MLWKIPRAPLLLWRRIRLRRAKRLSSIRSRL